MPLKLCGSDGKQPSSLIGFRLLQQLKRLRVLLQYRCPFQVQNAIPGSFNMYWNAAVCERQITRLATLFPFRSRRQGGLILFTHCNDHPTSGARGVIDAPVQAAAQDFCIELHFLLRCRNDHRKVGPCLAKCSTDPLYRRCCRSNVGFSPVACGARHEHTFICARTFANRISTFFALDLLLTVTCVLHLTRLEQKRLRLWWVPALITVLIEAFAGLPLLLHLRAGSNKDQISGEVG